MAEIFHHHHHHHHLASVPLLLLLWWLSFLFVADTFASSSLRWTCFYRRWNRYRCSWCWCRCRSSLPNSKQSFDMIKKPINKICCVELIWLSRVHRHLIWDSCSKRTVAVGDINQLAWQNTLFKIVKAQENKSKHNKRNEGPRLSLNIFTQKERCGVQHDGIC